MDDQRPQVGLLVPSSNTVMERDLHRALATWADVHTARMYMVDTTRAGEQRMLDEEAKPAARRVSTLEPDVAVFGCTSASSLHGRQYDAEFLERLAKVADAPILGVLNSVIDELADAGTVALFTPYVDELTDTIAASLRTEGVDVVWSQGLGIADNLRIGRLSPDEIVDAIAVLDLPPSNTLFCSCTNLRSMEVIDRLSELTGRRVVTSNQAVVSQLERRWRGR